jgi:hypothetical protein
MVEWPPRSSGSPKSHSRNIRVTITDVWKRLKAKAFTNLREFLGDNGGLLPPKLAADAG